MINNNISYYLTAHLPGEGATGRIAQFLRHMATLQLLGMERPFRVVAPCPAPQKPYTSPRPTTCLLYTSPSPRDRQNLVCRLLLEKKKKKNKKNKTKNKIMKRREDKIRE